MFNSTGALVRSFSASDLNPLHIGRNLFAWEGLDANGHPVPNGMYVYRIKIKSEGKVIEKNGKLILVR
jgi:flagellar hook assembly protein FlgD